MATRKVVKFFRGENPREDAVFFGEIVRDGLKITAAFGNTNKLTKVTSYYERFGERAASSHEAEKRFEALIESRGKNYEKKDRTEADLPAIDETLDAGSFNLTLEAEIVAAREPAATKAAASVYADWLQQQSDVRGELASLFLAGQEDEAREWLAKNPTKLFGDLDVKLNSEVGGLVWEHGFLRGASLKRQGIDSKTDLAALTRAFLALPVARLVTELRFGLAGYENDNDWSETLAAVAESQQAPQIRVLRFDDYTSEDSEISWTAFGDFSPYWSSLPQLEELVIASGEGGTLGDLALPNLRKFTRISGGLGEDEITAIFAARWPKLEHLEVWFGDEHYGGAGKVEHLAPLLDGRISKKLTHLGIVNCEFVHEVIGPLARSPLLQQLRTLDLSKGALQDTDVDLLLTHADAFHHLDLLDLSENLLNARGAEIYARLPHAKVDEQRYGERGDDEDESRYVALGE
ncbi:MAG: hypothetical protein M4D80_33875 [Myxococcota bacterium]|nr:hypothetical protein [Myxococcota bacterium]